jgi:hypothetical protein
MKSSEPIESQRAYILPTAALDLEGAKARYMEALCPKQCCEYCGKTYDLRLEPARTAYAFKGKIGSLEDPNRPVLLCRECSTEYHTYWDEMWAGYYQSVM